MPPEVLRGAVADAGADVYALGVLLYRILSGQYPYPADTFDALLAAQDRGAAVPLLRVRADVPAELSQLLGRVLESDPAQRLSQPSELMIALGDIARARHPQNSARRVRNAYALAAALAIALLACVVWWPRAPTPAGSLALAFNRENNGQLTALPVDATLHVGDLLALSASLPQSSFVYILNEDAAGQLSALFPLADLDRRNPLPAGSVELPGLLHGQPFRWRVSSGAASEEFLVVISPTSVDTIERALSAAVQPAPSATDAERGIAALQARGRALPHFGGARLAGLVAQLAQRPDFEHMQLRRFEFAQRN